MAGDGQLDAAIAQYREALEIQPGNAEAHNNLSVALGALGRFDEAIIHCQEALKRSPHAPAEVHFNLALALARRGRFDEAIAHYRQGLEIKPDDARARGFLGRLWPGGATGRVAGPVRAGRAAETRRRGRENEFGLAAGDLPEASLRDGAAAIEHAERALRLCDGRRVDVLDAPGAAYAEVGRFPEALAAARKPWNWP